MEENLYTDSKIGQYFVGAGSSAMNLRVDVDDNLKYENLDKITDWCIEGCLQMEKGKKALCMDELTEEEQVLVKLYRGLDRSTQLWAIYALNLGNKGKQMEEKGEQ